MIFFPNAKINIGLDILRKRADGYHDISSVFYPIGLHDALEVIPAADISFAVWGQGLESNQSNLVLKAFDLLSRDYKIPPVSTFLLKGIPIGAGLGGGSADAAFMIAALTKLFDLDIPVSLQEDYARRLGSDCAFFIQNKPIYCYEKGDRFEKTELSLKGYQICLVNPGIHVSTSEAYSGVTPAEPDFDLRDLVNQPIYYWKNSIKNDFEKSVFPKYPILNEIKQALYHLGAIYASMSGSGSSVYGIFENLPDLDNKFKTCFVWQGELN